MWKPNGRGNPDPETASAHRLSELDGSEKF